MSSAAATVAVRPLSVRPVKGALTSPLTPPAASVPRNPDSCPEKAVLSLGDFGLTFSVSVRSQHSSSLRQAWRVAVVQYAEQPSPPSPSNPVEVPRDCSLLACDSSAVRAEIACARVRVLPHMHRKPTKWPLRPCGGLCACLCCSRWPAIAPEPASWCCSGPAVSVAAG